MNVKHIFFDLDHTLWDFETNSAKTFEKIFRDNNINVSILVFLNYYKPINFEYWRLYRNEKISKEKLRYGRLKNTFDKMNFKISDTLIDQLSDDYIYNLSNFNVLFDGTIEILDYLKSKYQLHIITNGFSEIQANKIKNSKIDAYFDKIITSDSVGVKKPNPKIFEYALKVANATKNESIMIGDSWEADIMGAKNFGIQPIYCNFENQPIDPSIISISHLLELKNYL
jgi:putative hydrolase of the HAD superfamily